MFLSRTKRIAEDCLSQFLSFDVYRLCVRLLHVSDLDLSGFVSHDLLKCVKKNTSYKMHDPEYLVMKEYIYISLDSCILYSIWILISLNYICQNIFLNSRSLVSFDGLRLLKQQCQLMSAARKKIKVFLMSYNVPIKVIVTL